MKNKNKLLVLSDYPEANTGFGRVSKELLSSLEKDYDIYCLGPGYDGRSPFNSEFFKYVYPINPPDVFGLTKLEFVLEDLRPDKIFMLNDPFILFEFLTIIENWLAGHISKDTDFPAPNVIAYTPIDNAPIGINPLLKNYVITNPLVSKFFAYSEFSNKTLSVNWEVMYHGVDSKTFRRLPEAEIVSPYPRDKFKVLMAGNLSHRKNHLAGLVAVKRLMLKYPNEIFLITKIPYKGRNMGSVNVPSGQLEGMLASAGFTPNDEKVNLSTLPPQNITDEDLNTLYNSVNLGLFCHGGEGFGLIPAEMSATETTVLVSDNSVSSELFKDTQVLMECDCETAFPLDNSVIRQHPSINVIFKALETQFLLWRENGKQKIWRPEARENILRFSWNTARKQFQRAVSTRFDESEEITKVRTTIRAKKSAIIQPVNQNVINKLRKKI